MTWKAPPTAVLPPKPANGRICVYYLLHPSLLLTWLKLSLSTFCQENFCRGVLVESGVSINQLWHLMHMVRPILAYLADLCMPLIKELCRAAAKTALRLSHGLFLSYPSYSHAWCTHSLGIMQSAFSMVQTLTRSSPEDKLSKRHGAGKALRQMIENLAPWCIR